MATSEIKCTAIVACVSTSINPQTLEIGLDRPYDVIVRSAFPASLPEGGAMHVFISLDGCDAASGDMVMLADHVRKHFIARAEVSFVAQPGGLFQVPVQLHGISFPSAGDYMLVVIGPDGRTLNTKRLLVQDGRPQSDRLTAR